MKESIEKLNEIILTKKEIFRTAHRYAKKWKEIIRLVLRMH